MIRVPFLSYLPKHFMQIYGAQYEDAMLVPHLDGHQHGSLRNQRKKMCLKTKHYKSDSSLMAFDELSI